ncbi:MAG TPA: GAP family protein, partial [Acidimicrobiales bacterium]
MAKVDTMPIWVAAGLGVLLQPWPFVAAGAASVAGMDLSAWAVVSLVLFGVLATSSLLTMEVYVILAPEGGQIRLTRLRTWLEVNRSQVLTVLALVLGAALVVKAGIQLLS